MLFAATIFTIFSSDARAQTGTINGTLRDQDTLAPLFGDASGAFFVVVHDAAGLNVGGAATDVNGLYQIPNLAPGSYYVRISTSPGYVPELHDNIACIAVDCVPTAGTPVVLGAGATVTVNFALAKEARITGTVSIGGVAGFGPSVSIYNASTSFVQIVPTASDGTYVARGLAAGTYFARAGSKLYNGISCPVSPILGVSDDCRIASGTPIVANAGSTTAGIDFSVDPAGMITGTVVREGTLTGLSGVLVGAFIGDREIGRGLTLPSGDYFIPVTPDVYTVRTLIDDTNLVNEWHDGQCVGCLGTPTPVVVGAGANASGIDFVLAAGGAISGRVTCQFRPFDFAVGPVIHVFSSTGAPVRSTRFDSLAPCPADYLIEGLPAGQYYLLARDVPFTASGIRPSGGILIDELYGGTVCVTEDCDVRRGAPVAVTVGGTTPGIDFSLASGAFSGAFASTALLSIFDERGVELESVIRVSIGTIFQQQIVGIPPGTYYARFGDVLHSGYLCPDCPPAAGTPIVVRPGDNLVGPLNFTASSAVRRIGGLVTDASGGAPLSTIGVEIVSGSGQIVASATTDLAGRYLSGPMPPGRYFVRTSNDRGYVDETYDNQPCATCDPRSGTAVTVGAGADVTGIDFALAAGGILSGAVTDAAGLPLTGIPISVFDAGGSLAGRRTSGMGGRFRFTVPGGTYRARAEPTRTHGGELYSEMACTSGACGPASGTAIPVTNGAITPNVNFTLASCASMTLSPALLATGVDGIAYRQVLGVSGGVAPFAFEVVDGALPLGVTLDRSSGLLSGVPSLPGRHQFRVAAVAATGCSTENAYVLDVQDCTYRLSPTSATVPAAGGNVLVTITDGCGPLPAMGPTSDFVHVQSGPPMQLSFTIDPNTAAAPRIGTAIVGRRVFTVRQAGLGSQPPIGLLELPQDGSQIAGAVAVGGWALDDLEVVRVEIYRDAFGTEPAGLVFLGNAVFIPGARPDVAQAFPSLPLNDRAGFGFMILTNMLPNQGNGTFRIHAVAEDAEGMRVLLGSRTIIGVNSTSQMPFGTLDAPGQGETIGGANYLNWGWALTPQTATIPFDGSTIQVIVDGVPVGNPTYNLFRPDVSGAFPGLANTPGPVGFRAIDTTALAEGLHTISWLVTDDRPASSGIGSRYFTVANSADALPPTSQGSLTQPIVTDEASSGARGSGESSAEAPAVPIGVPAAPDVGRRAKSLESEAMSDGAILVQRDDGAKRRVRAPAEGPRRLTLAPMERLTLTLDEGAPDRTCGGTWAGYLVKDDVLRDLPVGASLDPAGTFYWQTGPGFAGRFALLFVRTDCDGSKHRLPVVVTIENR